MIAIKQEKKNINKKTENAIKPSFVGGGAGFFTEGVGDGNGDFYDSHYRPLIENTFNPSQSWPSSFLFGL